MNEQLSTIACHWTTELGIEISPEQVVKCLTLVALSTDVPDNVSYLASLWRELLTK